MREAERVSAVAGGAMRQCDKNISCVNVLQSRTRLKKMLPRMEQGFSHTRIGQFWRGVVDEVGYSSLRKRAMALRKSLLYSSIGSSQYLAFLKP